jgi:hypothetical protein
MREEAIVLLAAASSFIFVTASAARAQPNLHQRLENASPESSISTTASYGPGLQSGPGLGLYGSIGTPHMITWSLCRTPSSRSARSVGLVTNLLH